MQVTEKNGVRYYTENGVVQSVYPAETHFGFSYWSYLIPPFKPANVLILGYGIGTAGELIRKIYGDTVLITGVDKHVEARQLPFAHKNVTVVERDVLSYLSDTTEQFDYVIVDLFNGSEVDESVFNPKVPKLLARIVKKMLAINTYGPDERYKTYAAQFDFLVSKHAGSANDIIYFVPHGGETEFSERSWNV